ncbi:aminoacyl-tRNA hydrolase [Halonatronum saccharophilum]|uniref:aminoacyl-tRNA hydrolase n=1 Tax=Halonatronum saccharophilum TaxID=150060 RepID=UPI0004863F86|nr:aminoacyl-tRNA hydrolase [Halonatronum saccharophilum]
MKLVVGLGNPGPKYETTRHNAGFLAIDKIADYYRVNINSKEKKALVAKARVGGEKIILAKPQTYMNNSGQAVRALADYYNIVSEDIIIIYDDLDLDLGKIKIKKKGGHGGHNGIKSIFSHLGTKEFTRLRVGIGRPEYGNVVDYVLGRFSKQEIKVLEPLLDDIRGATELCIEEKVDKAMNRYN